MAPVIKASGRVHGGLALVAGPCAVMSASPLRHSVADVDIIVDGAPQPRYAHDGRWLVEVSKLAREGRFDYLLVESTGISEPLPVAEPRLGRRTVLTFPLVPPPQKN